MTDALGFAHANAAAAAAADRLRSGLPAATVGVILGSAAIAAALAFGLGGRDWAAKRLEEMSRKSSAPTPPAPVLRTTPPRPAPPRQAPR